MSGRSIGDVEDDWAELLSRFGGPVSHVLSDPQCRRFRTPEVTGVIPYRQAPGCRVAIGDPVAAPEEQGRLMRHFAEASFDSGQRTVFAAASATLASHAVELGYGAVQYGEEVVVDARADLTAGSVGRELRKKINRARNLGVVVHEHLSCDPPELGLALRRVAAAWRSGRSGPQIFISPVNRVDLSLGRRCFYAVAGGDVVGVLTLLRVEARNGWAIEHLLHAPGAPPGTTESLVVHATRIVGAEGAEHVTFGPAISPRLDNARGLGKISEYLAKLAFRWAERTFSLGSIMRYREKFGSVRKEPSFLLFPASRVGPVEVYGLIHAFTAH